MFFECEKPDMSLLCRDPGWQERGGRHAEDLWGEDPTTAALEEPETRPPPFERHIFYIHSHPLISLIKTLRSGFFFKREYDK